MADDNNKQHKRRSAKESSESIGAGKKPKKSNQAQTVPLAEDPDINNAQLKQPETTPPEPEELKTSDVYELLQKSDAIPLADAVYQLWKGWADFELTILHPILPEFMPPVIVAPEPIPGTHEEEFVYPIHDYGYKFLISKQPEIFSAGRSMCKLYYTIEKIITLLVDRLKREGIDQETEVQAAFGGHPCAQRKGFEVIINLRYNVVVINFDPGVWGERYLKVVKNLSDLGYGYPSEAPRDTYRRSHGAPNPKL